MVYLVSHQAGMRYEMADVPHAREVINKSLSDYMEYEERMKDFLFDLSPEDSTPQVHTYSIAVNDEIVWTNKHLF